METLRYLLRALAPLLEDMFSVIVFGIVYSTTNNLVAGIVSGMVVGALQIGFYKLRGRPVYIMQWMSFALVIVLGSISILSKNPHFAMFKPSIGAFVIGCVMLNPSWQARYMPQVVRDNLSRTSLLVWGYVWAATLFALAGANFYVANYESKEFWAWYTSIVPTSVELGLFLIQFMTIRAVIRNKIRAGLMPAPAE